MASYKIEWKRSAAKKIKKGQKLEAKAIVLKEQSPNGLNS
jgi:hypothetical protein